MNTELYEYYLETKEKEKVKKLKRRKTTINFLKAFGVNILWSLVCLIGNSLKIMDGVFGYVWFAGELICGTILLICFIIWLIAHRNLGSAYRPSNW